MIKTLPRFLFVLGAVLFPIAAHAHFIWATVDPGGKTLRLEIAEEPGVSVAPIFGKFLGSIKGVGIGAMVAEKDGAHIVAPLSGKAGAASLLYGLHGTDLIHWFAKGATDLGSAGKSLGQQAEIVLRSSKGGLTAIVSKDGKPAPQAEFEAHLPGVKEAFTAKTDAKGEAHLPKTASGLLAIGAIVVDKTPGTYEGKAYIQKAYMCSLTVRLP